MRTYSKLSHMHDPPSGFTYIGSYLLTAPSLADNPSHNPFSLQRESAREQSFKSIEWPHENSQLTPARLAAAGFYAASTAKAPDRVVCFACENVIFSIMNMIALVCYLQLSVGMFHFIKVDSLWCRFSNVCSLDRVKLIFLRICVWIGSVIATFTEMCTLYQMNMYQMYLYKCINSRPHTNTNAHTHTRTRTHAHTHTRTHTNTHTHAHTQGTDELGFHGRPLARTPNLVPAMSACTGTLNR